MAKILILNGPSLNMLGRREPEIYGTGTLADLEAMCRQAAARHQLEIDFRQSNHEGELVTWLQEAHQQVAAIIINAAAYTHTSIAILDALSLHHCPIIEVHLSDITRREAFRRHSYISLKADRMICGKGQQGYVEAIDDIAARIIA